MGDGRLFGGVERNRRLGAWRSPHMVLEQSLSNMPGKAKHTHLDTVGTRFLSRPQAGRLRSVGFVLGWRGMKETGMRRT